MKKLIPIFLMLVLAFSCKDEECKDEYCPVGFKCVDGVCEDLSGNCPIGYEGEDCETTSNAKFAGDYDTDYTGTGGLANSGGNTIASVSTVSGKPNKIRIDVSLELNADVLGTALDLPLDVSIEGEVDGDKYYVSETNLTFEVDGLPVPISITFEVEGTKISETQLNSTITFSGLVLNGTIDMEGTKQ